jgi:hypothetical protein
LERSPIKKQTKLVDVDISTPATPSKLPAVDSIPNSATTTPYIGRSMSGKQELDARSFNSYLEEGLLCTVRKDLNSSGIAFIGEDFGKLLNAYNISPVIFERINGDFPDTSSAIIYLVSSYKRLSLKESTIPSSLTDDGLR